MVSYQEAVSIPPPPLISSTLKIGDIYYISDEGNSFFGIINKISDVGTIYFYRNYILNEVLYLASQKELFQSHPNPDSKYSYFSDGAGSTLWSIKKEHFLKLSTKFKFTEYFKGAFKLDDSILNSIRNSKYDEVDFENHPYLKFINQSAWNIWKEDPLKGAPGLFFRVEARAITKEFFRQIQLKKILE